VGARLGEVVFDEAVLSEMLSVYFYVRSWEYHGVPSAVPEVQHQIAHELDIAVLHVDGRAKASHVLCDIVAEDDASHRRLAGAALAHQQHLALLLPLGGRIHLASAVDLARCGGGRCLGRPLYRGVYHRFLARIACSTTECNYSSWQ